MVNNELERPHVIALDGLYYMFWSTQTHVFAPSARHAPTGLDGMVSSSLAGGWRPLNGSGLVFANPRAAPRRPIAGSFFPICRSAVSWTTGGAAQTSRARVVSGWCASSCRAAFSDPHLPAYLAADSNYVAISDSDRSEELNYVATVHHGIDLSEFTPANRGR